MQSKLKEFREDKGLSQVKLSELSGVCRPVIVKIENQSDVELKVSTLVKIADALGAKVTDIFF